MAKEKIKRRNSVLMTDTEENLNKPLRGRKTKIICTIGPSSKEIPVLCKMMEAGMNISRLNFSHGTHEYYRETISNIREASKKVKLPCAVLLDTKGPEIRTGKLENGKPVLLKKGQTIKIHCAPGADFVGNSKEISVDYAKLSKVVAPGTVVKIADGLILIKVTSVEEKVVIGTLMNEQELGEKKGVNLPGIETGLPAMTAKDREDILFGLEQNVDIIAASFINSADAVKGIRTILGDKGKHIKIISKIESVKGLDNFDAILEESDGIMIARGDLGVEIPIQKVCMAQKTMINKCNAVGKPIVTATQMLDSMIKNPSPTRAEVGDVFNAVLDGSDCVMLSGESANGSYPVEAVSTMARICRRSEASIDYGKMFKRINEISIRSSSLLDNRTEGVTSAAVKIANELKLPLIFTLTDTGRTSGLVSKYMPPVPVICVTPSDVTFRQALIRKGLWPVMVDSGLEDDERYRLAEKIALEKGWCAKGDNVVVVSGRKSVSGSSYQLRILTVEF